MTACILEEHCVPNKIILAHRPTLQELHFRERLLSDEETMSYNAAWGGTIPFPTEKWESWYSRWVEAPADRRYYRYLYEPGLDDFVGEISYHYDEERRIYLCDVMVLAKYRGCGFGTAGIDLVCRAAKENGIDTLYDDIAADNPAYRLFLKNGFVVDYQNDDVVMVKKKL